MTKAKEIADQYNALRSDFKSKVSKVQKEKRQKEKEIRSALEFK